MNARDRMKTGCVAAAIFAVMLCAAVEPATWAEAQKAANTITYDNNGSGGWNDTTRWVGGVVPGPQNSVKINNAKGVVIRDEDLNVFTNVWWYRIENTSFVTIDCTNNVVFPGCFRAGNKSTIVKVGTNRFEFTQQLDTTYCMYTASKYVVSNGCVRFGQPYYYESCTPAIEVWKPGVAELYTKGASMLLGIAGDGLVTNTSSAVRNLKLWAQRTSGVLGYGPWTFSGTIGNTTKIVIGEDDRNPDSWGTQYFLGTNNVRKSSSNNAIIMYHGFVGVEEPGFGVGSATSVPGYIYQMYGATNATMPDTGFIYLGKGGLTDMRIDYYNKYGKSRLIIDGGAHGGLVFADGAEDNAGRWRNLGYVFYKGYSNPTIPYTSVTAERFVLTGSNTTTCVISNSVVEGGSDPFICFIKQGKGTWRFAERPSNMCNNKGPILVEQGRLEFDSFTALGTGTKPFTNFWEGVEQEDTRVQYLYRIGNGTNDVTAADLATMAYLGAGAASSGTSRKFAVCGAGRIENGPNAGGLSLTGGVFSDCEGTNTLVLAGPGNNSITHVTNAIGTLSVVKEDAGSWELFGTVRIADAEVKGGNLVFDGHAICPALKVDGGASLVAETSDLAVNALRFDALKGAGTIRGAVFADDGEICLTGVAGGFSVVELGGNFAGSTGIGNLARWRLRVNGDLDRRHVVAFSSGRMVICPRGTMMVLR